MKGFPSTFVDNFLNYFFLTKIKIGKPQITTVEKKT